ncbi:MAG: molybdopterin-synthase adenylyltransferase MoeB [Bacteroidia bacterium]|nr:molybdopterin-synthase adenylyltransferase MoeB [Bacteroidia bacterium]
MNFSKEELQRYSRHLAIPEFGIETQESLKSGSVLVVGAGGLGSPLLYYLAAAGIGKIGIVEFDTVDISNLQRQILYSTDDVGKSKAQTARERIQSINPHIEVILHETRLTEENARELIRQYDVVADGTDNFDTRYLVNDTCVLEGKTNVYASVLRFEGQASVFNFEFSDETRGPNYRDLYPTPPPASLIPNCAEGGVLGVLPGIMGSIQATEVIKVLAGIGEPLVGRLFILDALTFTTRILNFKKRASHDLDSHKDEITDVKEQSDTLLPELSPMDLKERIAKKPGQVQLIDVRDPWEYEADHLDAINIPLAEIMLELEAIEKNNMVVVYCNSGQRGRQALMFLSDLLPEVKAYNLAGGLDAWKKEVNAKA